MAKNALTGKRLIFLGSSVTYGSEANGVSFVHHIAKRNDCHCLCEAVSGTTLTDIDENSYVRRLMALDPATPCDHFLCQLSTNDASQGLPPGRIASSRNQGDFDVSTIAGSLEFIIAHVDSTWHCPFTLFTNPYYDSEAYGEMVKLAHALREKWSIGVLDLWNDAQMRTLPSERRAQYMADDIHPNDRGYRQWWTPMFERYLLTGSADACGRQSP